MVADWAESSKRTEGAPEEVKICPHDAPRLWQMAAVWQY